MRLNIERCIEQAKGKDNPYYDLDLSGLQKLIEISQSPYALMDNSFCLGYVQGMKAAKAEMKKRRAETNG